MKFSTECLDRLYEEAKVNAISIAGGDVDAAVLYGAALMIGMVMGHEGDLSHEEAIRIIADYTKEKSLH